MSDTKIEWATKTWNPVTGCTKVSPGCAHCYAETLTKRFAGQQGYPAEYRPWTPENAGENVVPHPERLDAPLHWKKPQRVFVNSMSDLFHENVPDEFIDRVFGVMGWADKHTFQVLTKRPERMRRYLSDPDRLRRIEEASCIVCGATPGGLCGFPGDDCGLVGFDEWPLPNVHLGVSVENQHWADVRIPLLLQTPAAVRFLSCEPLLAPVDLAPYSPEGVQWNWLLPDGGLGQENAGDDGEHVSWVIVGGESGPGARPMDIAWVRSIRDQCSAAGVALFVKQLGKRPVGLPPLRAVRKGDNANRAIETWPEDLRIREFPKSEQEVR